MKPWKSRCIYELGHADLENGMQIYKQVGGVGLCVCCDLTLAKSQAPTKTIGSPSFALSWVEERGK